MYAQQTDFPKLIGPYLGQKPPGMLPEIFAPEIISLEGSNEFRASFSTDGRRFYRNREMTIMVCSLQHHGWTASKPASVNGNWRDHTPHLAVGNKRMFVGGSRPPIESPHSSASIEGDSKVKRESSDSIVLTILYDNKSLDDSIIADHGFSCLVESGGRACLFDAGRVADKLMTNAKMSGVDFSRIKQVFISHFHDDHMGELIKVLGACNKPQLYLPFSYPQFPNEALGESAERDFRTLLDGYKPLVSEIIRKQESVAIDGKYSSTGTIENITYEQSLLVPTSKGLIILTGCSHPGIVEIVRHSKRLLKQDAYCVLGGFHLVSTDPAQLRTIAQELRRLTKYIGPCHCTGAEAQAILRDIYQDDYLDIHAGKKLQFNTSARRSISRFQSANVATRDPTSAMSSRLVYPCEY